MRVLIETDELHVFALTRLRDDGAYVTGLVYDMPAELYARYQVAQARRVAQ